MSEPKKCERCGDALCPMLKTFPASDPFNLHWRAFKLCNQNRIAAALEARNRALCKCDPSPDDHEIGCPMWRLP